MYLCIEHALSLVIATSALFWVIAPGTEVIAACKATDSVSLSTEYLCVSTQATAFSLAVSCLLLGLLNQVCQPVLRTGSSSKRCICLWVPVTTASAACCILISCQRCLHPDYTTSPYQQATPALVTHPCSASADVTTLTEAMVA